MKRTLRVPLYIGLSAVSLLLLSAVGFSAWMSSEPRLPSEQTARQQFAIHQTDYARLASLLCKVPRDQIIGNSGTAPDQGAIVRLAPEYRELMQRIGAKFVDVRHDGSVEFALWGSGCAICSDSYMGVLYRPLQSEVRTHAEWTSKMVKSFDDKNLRHKRGSVADGLYVVKIEPEWFIYRFEYHE